MNETTSKIARSALISLLVVSVLASPDATAHGASEALTVVQFLLLFALPFTHQPRTHTRRKGEDTT